MTPFFIPSASLAAITEYPVPADGGLRGPITTGSDGALWFTDAVCSSTSCSKMVVGRLTTSGGYSEYPTSLPPFSITDGPDGALWFTEDCASCADNIGRLTTLGSLTEYLVEPEPFANAQGIAAGPDGALWFTQTGPPDSITRVTTSGRFTSYPVSPPPGFLTVGPHAIAAGPDGALWFTELSYSSTTGVDQIGRITTSGTVTEFPILSLAISITAGPDGALWFTEGNPANDIGRITTTGEVTEYPIPTPHSGAGEITAGPDGALWFTEANSDKIGRITTSGTITEYPLPTPNSEPYGITAGPDGALWFTEIASNQIGRITVPGSGRSTSLHLTCSPSAIVIDRATTCTFRVSDTASGVKHVPTGSVSFATDSFGSFAEGGQCTLIPTSSSSAKCTITYTPTALGSGSHTLTANYGGDGVEAGGSASVSLTVTKRPTSTRLACTPGRVAVEHSTTCTATVTDTAAGTKYAPSGTASFASNSPGVFGGDAQCTLTATSASSASCSVTYVPSAVASGVHVLTTSYGGDSLHSPSSRSKEVTVT